MLSVIKTLLYSYIVQYIENVVICKLQQTAGAKGSSQ